MKPRDLIFGKVPTFESKLLYAQLTSPSDVDYETAFGYKIGGEFCLECDLSVEELEEYVKTITSDDEYEKGYAQAIKDFLREVK